MRIEVDPDALIGAGQHMGQLGSQLSLLSGALGQGLSGGIASGTDPAGMNFGFGYGRQAQAFAAAMADAANAFTAVGRLLEATGHNYRNADAASTISGAGAFGTVGADPGTTVAAHIPLGPNGVVVTPPAMWHLVQPLLTLTPGVGMFAAAALTWPSGHPALLGVTAIQWRNFATGFALISPQMTGIRAAVAAQSIPEGATIIAALDNLDQAITAMSELASTVAKSISGFAAGVQAAQDAIRRLLDRLSFAGLWDTVTGFLTGEGDDILVQVARDVGTVLDNFQHQVKGYVGLLDELVTLIGEAATVFQRRIRPVLVEYFGDVAGGVLADAVTLHTDFQVGAVTGLIKTVSGMVAYADVDTWKGMGELALAVAQDPLRLPGVWAEAGKELVAWDAWSGEHPGRGAGELAFNIASLVAPGGPFSKTGGVNKALTLAQNMLENGRFPHLREIGAWSRPGAPTLGNVSGTRAPEVPPVRPGLTAPPTQPSAPASSRPPAAGAEGGLGPRAPVEQSARPPSPAGTPETSSPAAAPSAEQPPAPPPVTSEPSGYAPHAPQVAAELNTAFVQGEPTSELAREVADLSTHHVPSPTGDISREDRVVLGKWDGMDGGYIGEARQNGGIYYDTGDATWEAMGTGLDDGQTRRLGWEINEQFLRTQLENGVSRIEYVVPPGFDSVEQLAAVQRLSFSAMEINFLKAHAAAFGYTQHGNTWIHEGAEAK